MLIKNALHHFSNVYGKECRAEFDNGTLVFNPDLYDANKSDAANFMNTLHPSHNLIAIGNPFNLFFSQSWDDMQNHRGWLDGKDEHFLYLLNQDDQPILIDSETGELFAMTFGTNEKFPIAQTLADFICVLSDMMDISSKYIAANTIDGECDENYFLNEDEDYLAEIQQLLDRAELKINRENLYSFLFVGTL